MKACIVWLVLWSGAINAAVKHNTLARRRAPWTILSSSLSTRGGAGGTSHSQEETTVNTTATLKAYITAVEERDHAAASGNPPWEHTATRDNDDDIDGGAPETTHTTDAAEDNEHAMLGIKEHKKSNAVGDPDSDSDDDDDSETEEWQDLDDFMSANNNQNNAPDHQVQVQVELVSEVPAQDEDSTKSSSSSGGGVRLGRRKPKKKPVSTTATHISNAWLPHIYVPPSKTALDTLQQQSRTVNAFGKSRLDRRTLYAGLLLEWQHGGEQKRKFVSPQTSQTLQAALSLATQPHWRQAAPQSSGITLYTTTTAADEAATTTLAMQETIAMALAHSLGCGMVILDDAVLDHVKKSCGGGNIKPAVLLESLLSTHKARTGNHHKNATTTTSGSIASMMERDLQQGLDDPFDERAIVSKEEMQEWEKEWHDKTVNTESLPLVVFIRTEASPSLLKSKSAMEYLQQECTSADSVHLLVLGKGIDATTETLPPLAETTHDSLQQQQQLPHMEPMDGQSPPWFGFSPQNQNASGQNDPEGSRRFNIFLARTMDGAGHLGILGAIAQPQAGNLFPHMMAIQARERMQQQQQQQQDAGSSPVKAELDRWTQLLQQQMQSNGGTPLPPPQFFNASLAAQYGQEQNPLLPPATAMPPPEVVQQALQQAMTEMLNRLAELNTDDDDDDDESNEGLSPELHKAFAQVLQNENLRRGIAENLARAAPALSDPKCQGVMLSVYVPPPPTHQNRGKLPSQPQKPPGGWFHKILNHHDDEDEEGEDSDDERPHTSRKDRVRTMAAAMATKEKSESSSKAERNLSKLESLCRSVPIQAPSDPVRQKSWEGWIGRERGAVIFRHNRRALNHELALRNLSLEQHTGTRGAGSALRQMLSVRDISDNVDDVVKCAVELEAAKSRRHQESDGGTSGQDLDVDVSLSQLLLTKDGRVQENVAAGRTKRKTKSDVKLLHPSSLETALTIVCRISPSPSGGLSLSSQPASHRSREDISALAQDKHERALISQVVSPQDIGVTYDMIGGLTDVKELLRQSITYPLKFPHLYSEGIAREAVKGVLLFGPPGTGKTMLAKAVATEGGASFLSVDASSVENKWLGESEKNAKAVFTLARRLAPCVIFIDEVDSLLSSREGSSDDSAHGTLTSVKTTMMSEWDGLNSGTNGLGEAGSDRVVVIGSTNRPFDLDEAVLRRFPRRILVDLPDMETRKEILEVTLAENRVDPAVNLTQIAERLDGYTGSDIKEVCREAVVQISHEQARLLDQGGLSSSGEDVTQGMLQRLRPVTMEDFEKALNKLKRSVSEKGRELARVWEWNDEYGEIKKDSKNHLPQLMNMYL